MSEPNAASATAIKPKKSVALSGVTAGNTALCTVGRTGNDLHYRGYDILDIAEQAEFEEVAYLLVHGKFPNKAELRGYKTSLKPCVVYRRRSKVFSNRSPQAVIPWMSCAPASLPLVVYFLKKTITIRLVRVISLIA